MKNEPRCLLCSGPLVLERNVAVQAGYPGWMLAWVCTDCSAAYPVATGQGGVFREAKPLYEHGERNA